MDEITVRILGDHGLFSATGKSIGYHVQIGESVFLVDCGAPLFSRIGVRELKEVKGVIITHCHNDHTKWLVDLALFSRYHPEMHDKVRLMTTDDIFYDLVEASGPALTKSLSNDSKTVIDIPIEEFIEYHPIGPRARFRIVKRDDGDGRFHLEIVDRQGAVVPPDVAKIIIHPKTKRPRLLFRDPNYGEWVEPASFYSFSSSLFYEDDKRVHRGDNFIIEALQAPSWHGVPCTGFKMTCNEESLAFSSDTVHDIELWKRLSSEKRNQKLSMSRSEFESASIIPGDINDYIERIWSEERRKDAMSAFADAAVIHDISSRNSVVHTDYEKLRNTTLQKEQTLLTHSSDNFSSEWPLSFAGKTYRIKGRGFREMVGNRLCPLDADIYNKERGRYFVGFKNRQGGYAVSVKDALLHIDPVKAAPTGKPLYSVDLYEDISGGYYPRLEDADTMYHERRDGRVELVRYTDEGSCGIIVPDQRERLVNSANECSADNTERVKEPRIAEQLPSGR